jgi:hypothetical protein
MKEPIAQFLIVAASNATCGRTIKSLAENFLGCFCIARISPRRLLALLALPYYQVVLEAET